MKKNRLVSLVMVLIILTMPILCNFEGNLVSYAEGKNILDINKTAKENSDGTYNITLEAKGEGSIKDSKEADIVLVIDSSGSMDDKIDKVKDAAKNLSKNIINATNDGQVRVAVANFYYNEYEYDTPGGSSVIQTDFTSDLNTIDKAINNIGYGGGTHTQDGIWTAQHLLEGARKGANQYVVFFSDGLPAESNEWGNTGFDIHVKNAQREYYKYFIGYGAPTQVTIGGIGYNPNPGVSTAETITVDNNPKYKNAKFYSVGLFTNANEETKNQAINFLKTIQNVIDPSKYADKYYTQDLNSINGIFNDISDEIKEQIKNAITKDTTIHDIVSKEFSIVENSYKITDLDGNEINIPSENINVSKNSKGEDEISFKIGDIIANKKDENNKLIGGVRVSFNITKKDPYFGGNGVFTNTNAEIKYKNPEDQTENEQIFNRPTVDIPYKTGKITIKKEIVKQNKNKKWSTIKASEINPNDTFAISILGNSGTKDHKYTVDLKGNEEASMDFYLRSESTDISNNNDISKNYFTEGLYDIDEIVPMNYKKVQVFIKDDNNKWVTFEKYVKNQSNINKGKAKDGKLVIGKDNNNINIKVRNTLVNDMFWQDKARAENNFKYD